MALDNAVGNYGRGESSGDRHPAFLPLGSLDWEATFLLEKEKVIDVFLYLLMCL